MISRIGRALLLALFAVVILIPVSLVFVTSLKSSAEFYGNPVGLPKHPSLDNFVTLFQGKAMGVYFLNSVYVTCATVFFVLFFASMIAYAITRIGGKKSWLLFGFFAVGMMVPAQVTMIPQYTIAQKLHLTNSLIGLAVISVTVLIPVGVFIMTGFMRSISKEIFEASAIDGAREWTIYSKIIMPISMPSVAATAIFLFVMVWNDLLYPLLFITQNAKKTLPLALLQFQGEYVTDMPMIFSGVAVASLPMVVAYIWLQRYFISGMMAGSVKG